MNLPEILRHGDGGQFGGLRICMCWALQTSVGAEFAKAGTATGLAVCVADYYKRNCGCQNKQITQPESSVT